VGNALIIKKKSARQI